MTPVLSLPFFVDEGGDYWLQDIRDVVHDPAQRDDVDEATQLCRQALDFRHDLWLPSIIVEANGLGRFLPLILLQEIKSAPLNCMILEHNSRND